MGAKPGNRHAVKKENNAGRKSLVDEKLRSAVITEAWEYLEKFSISRKTSAKEKRMVALELAKRTIPQTLEGEISLPTMVVKRYKEEVKK